MNTTDSRILFTSTEFDQLVDVLKEVGNSIVSRGDEFLLRQPSLLNPHDAKVNLWPRMEKVLALQERAYTELERNALHMAHSTDRQRLLYTNQLSLWFDKYIEQAKEINQRLEGYPVVREEVLPAGADFEDIDFDGMHMAASEPLPHEREYAFWLGTSYEFFSIDKLYENEVFKQNAIAFRQVKGYWLQWCSFCIGLSDRIEVLKPSSQVSTETTQPTPLTNEQTPVQAVADTRPANDEAERKKGCVRSILAPLSGLNPQKQPIMSSEDFERLINYADHLALEDVIPENIKPITQIDIPTGHISKTFHRLHSELYGTRRIHDSFIDFIRAVFLNKYSGQDRTVTKTNFSKRGPASYFRDFGLSESC
ncbi:hypothetical protein J2I47_25670 [Fibrella sp. HMF5335]|uniref:Uncharacterized protein n=1 Tax=Fibrella rubiginis TaxID=2817060 RepID=A0A939GNB0_9BACT|nr:hypothetical protein [Fibrella rubiginis]MBO0939960.1 hypothetical protein [Fibrella rubiginis]